MGDNEEKAHEEAKKKLNEGFSFLKSVQENLEKKLDMVSNLLPNTVVKSIKFQGKKAHAHISIGKALVITFDDPNEAKEVFDSFKS